MGKSYYVKPNMLLSAANQMSENLQAFRSATELATKAAEHLAGMWEGDARDAFYQEQLERAELYLSMQSAADQMILLLKAAANRYAGTDYTCAEMLRIN